jgi:hypothetical protein
MAACADIGEGEGPVAQDRLFTGQLMHQVVSTCAEAAAKAVERLSEADLLGSSVEHLIDEIVADKVPPLFRLDVEHHYREVGSVNVRQRQGLSYSGLYMPDARQPAAEWIEVRLHIPYAGTKQSLQFRPSNRHGVEPEADVTDGEVILAIADPRADGPQIEQLLLERERHLLTWVEALNADIAAIQNQVRSQVSNQLRQRFAVLARRDQIAAALTIPARPVAPDKALTIPARRRPVNLRPDVPRDRQSPEWQLDDSIYEHVIDTVTRFGHALERRPTSALKLLPAEETLRDWLLFLLNANYETKDGGELFVAGEALNGAGKTDILVRHADRNAFIGECKFWGGPAKFDKAIDQLLGYTVWRDTKAALVLFITQRDATAVINSAAGRLAQHRQYRQALPVAEPARRRDFRFASPADERRFISLALLPVVVPESGMTRSADPSSDSVKARRS